MTAKQEVPERLFAAAASAMGTVDEFRAAGRWADASALERLVSELLAVIEDGVDIDQGFARPVDYDREERHQRGADEAHAALMEHLQADPEGTRLARALARAMLLCGLDMADRAAASEVSAD